jgi:hypothetical protein
VAPAIVIHFHGVLQRRHRGRRATTEVLYDLECDGILTTGLRAARQWNEFAIDTAFDIPAATIRPVIQSYFDTAVATLTGNRNRDGAAYVEYPTSIPIPVGARHGRLLVTDPR